MNDQALNADFGEMVVMRTAAMDWQASPSPKVWRKRLELYGPLEAGRVTSLVRYEAASEFPPHAHPDGEEIFVLDGVFSDQTGDYGPGAFLLNPDGFSHAPFSREGCVLFVKLRQYPGKDRRHVTVQSNELEWQKRPIPGLWAKPLYSEDGHPESIRLVRFDPGTALADDDHHPGGEEIFVIEGTLQDEFGAYETGTWIRYPADSRHRPFSETGCTLYVKSGHLAP